MATETTETTGLPAPPEVRLREGQGAPVLWAPLPGPVTGALVCRVGMADETLRTHGISHLVEHLALAPLGRPEYDLNGHVDATFTVFHARGTLEEVTGFLQTVAGHLRELPLDRLAREKRILRTEAEGRSRGFEARLLGLRFGATGFGLVNEAELGIDWLGEDEVAAWARERFVTAGAAVWLSAEPPDDLVIEMNDGAPTAPPAPESLQNLRWPAHLTDGTGGVALTMVAERSSAVTLAGAVAADRAHERLRERAGLSYDAGGGYEPLDARHAHLVLSADCQDRDATRVRDELRGVLDELAEHGPEPAELQRLFAQGARGWDERGRVLGLLDAFARDHLLGRERVQPAQLQRERETTTPEEVAAALREALPTLLVLVPGGTENDDDERHATYEHERTAPVEGEVHASTATWRAWGQQTELVVGDAGVTVRDADGTTSTFRWDACVAGVRSLGDSIALVRPDSSFLTLHPRRYEDGGRVLAALLERLGPDRVVPLSDRERALEPVVREQLGDDGIARVGGELDALAPSLDEDEELRHLATATRGEQTGLVVLTDRRLSFVFEGTNGFDLVELRREDVRDARTKGLIGKRLVVDAEGAEEPLELRDVQPEGRMEELAAALA